MNVPGTHNDGPGGAFVTSDQSGSETFSNRTPYLPSYELTAAVAPHTISYGHIAQIKKYQEPHKTLVQIRVTTPKGDENMYLNTDQYRILQTMNQGKEPAEGDKARIALLRRTDDRKSQATTMGLTYYTPPRTSPI